MLILRAIGSALILMLLALGLADIARRTGIGLIPLISRRYISALERLGIGLLLGWGVLGTSLLGLALTGLFSPLPMAFFACFLILAARGANIRDPLICGALREIRGIAPAGLAICLGALTAILYRLLTPEIDGTSFLYHLAVPWNFLLAHRALLSHVSWSFHLPIPVDIGFAPALLLGDDRLAKWQSFSYLLAASAVYAGFCLRRGRPTAAWLGPLLTLSLSFMAGYFGSTKNDIPASAFFVVGALLTVGRSWILGGVFLGISVAAKFTYGPMALVWLAVMRPPRARLPWIVLLLFLPIIPWCIKSQLAVGNPLHPLTGLLFNSYDWAQINEQAAGKVLNGIWRGGFDFTIVSRAFLDRMTADYLVILLLAPGLLLLGKQRLPIVACLLAMLVNFAIRQEARYILPSAWLLMLFAAWEAEGIPAPLRIPVRLLAAIYAFVSFFILSDAFRHNYLDLTLSKEQYRSKERVIHHEALAMLRETSAKRVLLVGEWRTYLLNSRPIYNGYEGETPVIWKAVKESYDLSDLSKKFRQLGTSHLLYNHVTAALAAYVYRPFFWDQRMVRLYVEHCKRFQRMLGHSRCCDFKGGGYYLYEIGRKPVAPPSENIWFAPGMESLYADAIRLLERGLNRSGLGALQEHLKITPDVGQVWNEIGRAYHLLHDYPNALKYLRKFYAEGMIDYFNQVFYGVALAKNGYYDEAEYILILSLDSYPHHLGFICWTLADMHISKANLAVERGDFVSTQTLAEMGLKYLDMMPAGDEGNSGRDLRARLTAVIGQSYLMRGDLAMAGCLFLEACRTDPGGAYAANWRAIVRQLPPCPRDPRME